MNSIGFASIFSCFLRIISMHKYQILSHSWEVGATLNGRPFGHSFGLARVRATSTNEVIRPQFSSLMVSWRENRRQLNAFRDPAQLILRQIFFYSELKTNPTMVKIKCKFNSNCRIARVWIFGPLIQVFVRKMHSKKFQMEWKKSRFV